MSGLWVTATACVLAILGITALRPLALRIGLTDTPDHRKNHEGEIPLVGGLAVFMALTLTAFIYGFRSEIDSLLLGGGILVLVGAFDDRFEVSPGVRLLAQIVAALIMCWIGNNVVRDLGAVSLFGEPVHLGVLAVPFTVFATVALINSLNMADGIDGLAGSQSLLSLGGLAVAGLIAGDAVQMLPLLALCGALVAFLFFNLRTPWRRKASVFLGDAGSNLLGFVIAWYLIHLSQGSHPAIAPVAALWFVALPVFDTIEIVVRRVLRRRSPLGADREHLHHVFLLAGYTVSETVLAMGVLSFGAVLVGLLVSVYHPLDAAVLYVFLLCGSIFLGVILRTWRLMRFLHRSICRRKRPLDRRQGPSPHWGGAERRSGRDRRRIAPPRPTAASANTGYER